MDSLVLVERYPAHPVEFPRLGFALYSPIMLGYVVDSRKITGFCFYPARLFLAKQLLHFCVSSGANQWFISGLRMRRRRTDTVFSCQLSAISQQPSAVNSIPLD
jgi:hypothetical protein